MMDLIALHSVPFKPAFHSARRMNGGGGAGERTLNVNKCNPDTFHAIVGAVLQCLEEQPNCFIGPPYAAQLPIFEGWPYHCRNAVVQELVVKFQQRRQEGDRTVPFGIGGVFAWFGNGRNRRQTPGER